MGDESKNKRMHNPRRQSLRDVIVAAAVIGGHVLLLVVLSRAISQHPATARAEVSRRLLLVELERSREEEELPRKDVPREPITSQRPAARRAPQTPATSTAITVPGERARAKPAIDWYGEAEESARSAVEKGARAGPRPFGEHPVSPYRRCKPAQSSFEWNPEPDKAGFAGGLPFVRLGERCIVGLGFFGCAIGDLPKPNGRLFDDMHDPNRLTSSVPDDGDCDP